MEGGPQQKRIVLPTESEVSMHDFVIETLARFGEEQDLESHIGDKEISID